MMHITLAWPKYPLETSVHSVTVASLILVMPATNAASERPCLQCYLMSSYVP